jgi:hypothetical protein
MKAMNTAYAQSPHSERAAWVREHKTVLRSYWAAQMKPGGLSIQRASRL